MYEAAPLTQYWHNKDIPKDVAECITSFARQNPSLHQRIFDAVTAREYINERFTTREVRSLRVLRSACYASGLFSTLRDDR